MEKPKSFRFVTYEQYQEKLKQKEMLTESLKVDTTFLKEFTFAAEDLAAHFIAHFTNTEGYGKEWLKTTPINTIGSECFEIYEYGVKQDNTKSAYATYPVMRTYDINWLGSVILEMAEFLMLKAIGREHEYYKESSNLDLQ